MKKLGISSVYNIAPTQAFLPALVRGLYARFSEEEIAAAHLFVPTRRAAASLRNAFLNREGQVGNTAKLLPRIATIASIDEDELFFNPDPDFANALLDLPPALGATQRLFLLMQLIRQVADIPFNPSQLYAMAKDLGGLMDQALIHNVSLDALETYVPDDHEIQEHWQRSRRFLQIIYQNWPALLAERGVMDATARRLALLRHTLASWQRLPPSQLMLAAGSTASQPATAEWLRAISLLPQGIVVLPGLDQELEEQSWVNLEPSHPQYHMAQFLKRCQMGREQVEEWAPASSATFAASRNKIISEIMRPAASADQWRHLVPDNFGADVWHGLSRIDAKNDQQEAVAAALLIRAKLQEPDRRVALVTPSRSMAKRVTAQLTRWNINVDDSAGQRLLDTPIGSYLALLLGLLKVHCRPSDVMAFFKHPLTGLGQARGTFLDSARRLEEGFFRKKICGQTLSSWLQAMEGEDKLKEPAQLLVALQVLLAPMRAPDLNTMADFCNRLLKAAQNGLADGQDLFYGPNGESLAALLEDLSAASHGIAFSFEELRSIFEQHLAAMPVHKPYGAHPRLFVLGLLEARLLDFDTVILAGLNEDVWPVLEKPDPWLSNAMRRHIGLPLHDDTIGLMAHDFAQQLGQREVMVLRSLRSEGTPTQTSRWLLRLEAILEKVGHPHALNTVLPWLEWAENLDKAHTLNPCSVPSVVVSPAQWPQSLRLTDLELLVNDAYAFYARCILKLKKLEPLDGEMDARTRGTVLHNALCAWFSAYPAAWPEKARADFILYLQRFFQPYLYTEAQWQFLALPFASLAGAFYEWEKARRLGIAQSAHEQAGSWKLRICKRDLIIKARADRIDFLKNGSLQIVDYKTGVVPTENQIKTGARPQLLIEALMACAGMFENVPRAMEASLSYLKVDLNKGELEEKDFMQEEIGNFSEHRAGFTAFMESMMSGSVAFEPVPYASTTRMAEDYARLARVSEWSKGSLAQVEDGT